MLENIFSETGFKMKVALRLVNNPVAIIADANNPTPNRERLEEASALRQQFNYGKRQNIL